jgi:hypothetical protein
MNAISTVYSMRKKIGIGIYALAITSLFACGPQPGVASGEPSASPTAATPASKIAIIQHSEKKETLDGSTYRTIHVQVQNNDSELQDYVEVKATWFDKDGKIVGTGMGNTTNLAANAKRVIDVQGMEVDNAAKYELEVSTSPFQ